MEDRRRSRQFSPEASYNMTTKGNRGVDPDFSPTMTSSLVALVDKGARDYSPSYGSAGTVIVTESGVTAESSTAEADKVPLLSEKIRKKKQG